MFVGILEKILTRKFEKIRGFFFFWIVHVYYPCTNSKKFFNPTTIITDLNNSTKNSFKIVMCHKYAQL